MYRDDVCRQCEAVERFDAIFSQVQARHAALESFADARALIETLHDPDGEPESKNPPLLALIEEYQRSRQSAVLGLLIAAAFPMLDQIYASRTRDLPRRAVDQRD